MLSEQDGTIKNTRSWWRRREPEQRSNFQVEALEPRLLLSAELLPEAAAVLSVEQNTPDSSAIVEYENTQGITLNLDGWGDDQKSPDSTPNISEPSAQSEPENPIIESVDAAIAEASSASFSVVHAVTETAPPEADSASITEQLTTTLRSSNGPPKSVVETALQLWRSSGISDDLVDRLNRITVEIADLDEGLLGETHGYVVSLDADASGKGWFVDSTPADNSEFSITSSANHFRAEFRSSAYGRVDLLSVLVHEIGHVLGFEHAAGSGAMQETLATGERVLPILPRDVVPASAPISGPLTAAPTLDLSDSANNGHAISITVLSTGQVTVSGTATGDDAIGISGITQIVGNDNANITLTGADETTKWTLTGLNNGSLSFEILSPVNISFTDIQHLVGGTGNDSFEAAALLGIIVSVDGGGGTGVDTVKASSSSDLTLTNTNLNAVTIANIDRAVLTGKSVNASAFDGQVVFDSAIGSWITKGPAPANGGGSLVDGETVSGAINIAVVDPGSPNTIYIGAVNGGVWKTTNGGNTWTALTDELPSLAISSLALDMDDSSIVYAGTGSASSFGGEGGDSVGIYKSINGGDSWTLIGGEMRGRRVNAIVAKGNIVLAATELGLFRSDNGGTTFVDLSEDDLPAQSDDDDGDTRNDDRTVTSAKIVLGGNSYADGDEIKADIVTSGTVHTAATFKVIDTFLSEVTALSIIDAGEYSLPVGPVTLTNVTGSGSGLTLDVTFSFNEFNVPFGVVSALTAVLDPGLILYAAFPSQGVFRSDDLGVHWRSITNQVSRDLVIRSQRTELATVDDTVYVALISSSATLFDPVVAGTNPTIKLKREMPFYVPVKAGESVVLTGTTVDTLTVTSVDQSNPQYTTLVLSGTTGAHATTDLVTAGGWRLNALYKSTNKGDTWTALPLPGDPLLGGVHFGGQGDTHFSMAADPLIPDILYLGGDTTSTFPYVGNLWRYGAGSWASIVKSGTHIDDDHPIGTGPHADSRNMTFQGVDLIEVDDGGIYKLSDPDAASDRVWVSLNGDLSLVEFVSVSYDSVNNVLSGGAQDNGALRQNTPDGLDWKVYITADGMQTVTGASADGTVAYTYTSTQDLSLFSKITDPLEGATTREYLLLEINGTGTFDDKEIRRAVGANEEYIDKTLFRDGRFAAPIAVNAVDPQRFLIGTQVVYEEDPDSVFPDRGEDVSVRNGEPIWHPIADNELPESSRLGSIQALAYGGFELNGSGQLIGKGDIAYAAVQDVTKGSSGAITGVTDYLSSGSLWVRLGSASAGYNFVKDPNFTTALGAAIPLDIALDPQDWRRVFVLDTKGRVWYSRLLTSDASPSATVSFDAWTDLTSKSNIKELTRNAKALEAVVIDTKGNNLPQDDVIALLVAGLGGVFRAKIDLGSFTAPTAPDVTFNEFGKGLPNLLVMDVNYNKEDKVLVVGTLGRGAWIMENADVELQKDSSLRILGSTSSSVGDQIVLKRNPAKPWMLDVFLSDLSGALEATPVKTITFAPISQIVIDGRAGNDNILLDGTNGPIPPGAGLDIHGGDGNDVLRIQNHKNDRKHSPASGVPADGKYKFEAEDPFAKSNTSIVKVTAANDIESRPYVLRGEPDLTTVVNEVTLAAGTPAASAVFQITVNDGSAHPFSVTVGSTVNSVVVTTLLDVAKALAFLINQDALFDAYADLLVITISRKAAFTTSVTAPAGFTSSIVTSSNILFHTPESEFQGGLEALFDLAAKLFEAAAGISFAPFDLAALAGALNGTRFESPMPKGFIGPPSEEEGGEEEGEEEAAEVGIPPEASILQRLLEGAIELADLEELMEEGPQGILNELESIGATVVATNLNAGPFTSFADGVIFHVQFTKDLDGEVDLSVAGDALVAALSGTPLSNKIKIQGTVEVKAEVSINLTFGIDSNGFFIQPSADPEFAISHFEIEGDELEAEGRFGFLGVEASDLNLTFDEAVELRFDLLDPSGDGFIRIPEFLSSIGDLVDFAFTSPGTADVVLTGKLEAVAVLPLTDPFSLADTDFTFTWEDVSPDTPGDDTVDNFSTDFTGPNSDDFINFLKLEPQDLLNQLVELRGQLDGLMTASASFSVPLTIPVVDVPVTDLINISSGFNTRILSQLEFGAAGSGIPNFSSAQELLTGLVTSLADIVADEPGHVFDDITVALEDIGFDYDPDTGELTYEITAHFDFADEISVSTDFGFGAGLNVAFDANVDFAFTLGIDLDDLELSLSSLLANVFIKDASFSASIDFTADVTVSGLAGTIVGNASIDFSLADPDDSDPDGRISIAELIAAIPGDAESLITDLVVDGNVELAGLSFNLGGVIIEFSGDFTQDDSTLSSVTVTDGTTSEVLTNASLTTISVTNGQVFVGTGTDETDRIGFTGDVDSLAIVIIEESGGGRTWQAAKGNINSASFSGIEGLTAIAASVDIDINTTVDDKYVDFTTASTPISPGGIDFDYDNAITSLSGDVSLDVFGYVAGTATFDLTVTTMDVVTGNSDLDATLFGASIVSFELDNLNLFGGVGAVLEAGDPSTITDDDVDTANAVGFVVDNGSASFVSVKPAGLAEGDQTSFTGFHISFDEAVGLTGVNDFEMWVTGSLKLNLAKNADGSTSTARIDWDTATTTNDSDDDLLADLDIDKDVPLQIAGSASFRIGENNNIVASVTGFALNIATMNVDTGNTNIGDNGTLNDAEIFSITVDSADLFIGDNGPGLDPVTHEKEATPADAVGLVVNDASFTMVNVKSGSESYTAVDANVSDAMFAIVGIELFVSGGVKFNLAPTDQRVDWMTATDAGDPDDLLADLDISSDLSFDMTGSASINATFSAGIVAHAPTVDITRTEMTVTDGTITVDNAKVFSIDISGASVFVGTGGKLLPDHSNLDLEAIHDGGVGFLVENATFKMVLAKRTTLTSTDVNVLTSPDLAGPQTGPVIAVNPTDSQNLLIAATDRNPQDGIGGSTSSNDSVWVSNNGGRTWTRKIIPVPAGILASHGEPWVAFDKTGRAVFVHAVDTDLGGNGTHGGGDDGDHVVASAVSVDGGLTWTDAVRVTPTDPDDDSVSNLRLAVGPNPDDLDEDLFVLVYAEHGIVYAVTSEDGIVWTNPVQVSNAYSGNADDGPTGSAIAPVVGLGPNGEIYVAWEDTDVPGRSTIDVDVSTDGGKTWGFGDTTIYYDTDKYLIADLAPAEKDKLDAIADLLKADPQLLAELEGHTDRVGSDSANQTLSDNRAVKAHDYLIAAGVNPAQVFHVGLGEAFPAEATADGVPNALNRRVEVRIDRYIYISDVNALFPDRYMIPAQPSLGVGLGLSMGVDRSGGEHNGRVYIAFVDQADLDGNPDPASPDHEDLDIFVKASDGDVHDWTALEDSPNVIHTTQVRVSDDTGDASQFIPSLSVDQKTGYIAIGWYDARNSSGNDEVEFFVAYSKDGGESWSDNVKVSDGASNAGASGFPDLGLDSGVAFNNGVIHMAWADNSNSTDDNPDGALHATDIYYDRLSLTTSYLGIQAGLDDAHLLGVPGFEIWANGTVKMNKARDIDGNPSPLRLNWDEATTTHDDDGKLADLEITGDVTLQVKGAAAINIAGVLLAYTGLVEITFAETTVSDGEIELEWDPLESTCRHASLSIL